MNDIFAEMIARQEVNVYMDDVFGGGRTIEECMQRAQKAVAILAKHKLHAKIEKCKFAVQRVPYLGMIVTPGKIEMDPAKVQGVADWPTPTKLKDVQSFLGFANFYRRFIANYSDIVKPLDNLKRKDQKWEWTPKCQKAFDTLKERFLTKPILQISDRSKPFILKTYVSKYSSGSFLIH